MRTKNFLIITLFMLSLKINAADNKTGIKFYESGLYDAAITYFQKNKAQLSPEELPEALYYLGLSYCFSDNPRQEEALRSFNEGIEANAAYPYNYVGLGMLELKTDKKNAESYLKKAMNAKGYKKNAKLRSAIAEAYLWNEMFDEAQENIETAQSIDKKDPTAYRIEGDMLRLQKQKGDASGKYETALYFDPEYTPANLKLAEIYIPMNAATALEKLKAAAQADPEFVGTEYIWGNLCKHYGDYSKAIDHYARYINTGYYGQKELTDYAQALYFGEKYEDALQMFETLSEINADDWVTKRFKAYALNKTASPKALSEIQAFITTVPQDKLIAQDYICYAEALMANKNYTEALNYYKKAWVTDQTRKTILKEIALAYLALNDYDNAAQNFWNYLEAEKKYDPEELLRGGILFYEAGSKNENMEDKKKVLATADSLFTLLSEKIPDSHLGYMWRARTKALQDPETTQALAQPYYEKVIQIVEPKKENYVRELVESYKYMGYNNYLKGNNEDAKKYFDKILQIAPDDPVAKEAIQQLK